MSARRDPRPSAATTTATAAALRPPAAPLLFPAVPTGCGPSPHFEGRTLPCGVLCSYGDAPTLAQTYIVTSRDSAGLRGQERLVEPPGDGAPNWVLELQEALGRELRKRYAYIWTYAVGERNKAFQKDEELRAMGATDCTADMQAKEFEGAHEEISKACDGELTFFRIG